MSTNNEFGEILNHLLLSRGWSAARLAREINVDASYVRRWIRGDRIPSLQSDYVDQIITCIYANLDQHNTVKFNDAALKYLKSNDYYTNKQQSVSMLLRKACKAAQINSLEHKNNLENIPSNFRPAQDNFTGIPAVIYGREAILHAYCALIKAAGSKPSNKSGMLFLTVQGDKLIFDNLEAPYQAVRSAVIKLLLQGWNFYELWRLNDNPLRTLPLIENIIDFSGYPGQYEPIYFNRYGIITPPYDIFAVAGLGGFMNIAANNLARTDTALFINEPNHLAAIEQHFKQLSACSVPFFRKIPFYGHDYFYFLASEIYNRTGNLCIIDGRHITSKVENNTEINDMHNPRQSRLSLQELADICRTSEKMLQNNRLRIITTKKNMECYAGTDDCFSDDTLHFPLAKRIIDLRNIRRCLATYDNFELALLNDNKILPAIRLIVKGQYNALLELAPRINDKNAVTTKLITSEITIVNAFQTYADKLWTQIAPQSKDKQFNIAWLDDQISFLECYCK